MTAVPTIPVGLLIVDAPAPAIHSCQGPTLLDMGQRDWQQRYVDRHAGPRAQWTAVGILLVSLPEPSDEFIGPWPEPAAINRTVRRLAMLWPGHALEVHAPYDRTGELQTVCAALGIPLTMPTAGMAIGERIGWFRRSVGS
jgi:hypothetical protein